MSDTKHTQAKYITPGFRRPSRRVSPVRQRAVWTWRSDNWGERADNWLWEHPLIHTLVASLLVGSLLWALIWLTLKVARMVP